MIEILIDYFNGPVYAIILLTSVHSLAAAEILKIVNLADKAVPILL